MKWFLSLATIWLLSGTIVWGVVTGYSISAPNISSVPRLGGSIPRSAKCTSVDGLPDPKCNQPIINDKLTVKQICDPSFRTGTVRPPTSYTDKLKTQGMIDYGYPLNPTLVEEDHAWPIESLGNPTDPTNLWPQFWNLDVGGFDVGAHTKDKLENLSKKLLCSGKMNVKDLEKCFSDWVACYKIRIGSLPKFQSPSLGAID